MNGVMISALTRRHVSLLLFPDPLRLVLQLLDEGGPVHIGGLVQRDDLQVGGGARGVPGKELRKIKKAKKRQIQ